MVAFASLLRVVGALRAADGGWRAPTVQSPADFCDFPTVHSSGESFNFEELLRTHGAVRARGFTATWPARQRWTTEAIARDFGSYVLRSRTRSDFADVEAPPAPPPPGYAAYYPPGVEPYNATNAAMVSAHSPKTVAELVRDDDGRYSRKVSANGEYAVPFRTTPFKAVRRRVTQRGGGGGGAALRCHDKSLRRRSSRQRGAVDRNYSTVSKEALICGMLEDIRLPPFLAPRVSNCIKAGVMLSQRSGAGLGFHAHGLAINSQIYGYKRWFVLDKHAFDAEFLGGGSESGGRSNAAREARYRAAAEWFELGGAGASNPTSSWIQKAFVAPHDWTRAVWEFQPDAIAMKADRLVKQCAQTSGDLIIVADDVNHAVISVGGSVGFNLQPSHTFNLNRPHFFAAPCPTAAAAAEQLEQLKEL